MQRGQTGSRQMLTVRELLQGSRRPPARGRGGPRPARPLGAHLGAARPDAVAVGRRGAADHRACSSTRAERQREFVARLADHQLAGLGFGTGFGHEAVPEPLLEVAAEREFPVFEVPYEVPFIAITEAAFTQLVNEQYAVLRRALAAQERLERIVLSERGLEALAGALATLIGAAVLVFDARGEPLVQHAFRRPVEREARGRAAGRGARARPPARGAGVHAAGRGRAAGRWRCRSPPTARPGRRSGVRRADARGVAGGDQGQRAAVGLRPADAAPGGDDRRARAAARPASPATPSAGWPATCSPPSSRGELAGAELARRLEPFGLAERVAAIVVERPNNGRGSPAPIEAALLGGAARRGRAPGWSRRPGR